MTNKGKHLGALIKSARKEKNMSQTMLSYKVFGFYHSRGAQTISNCERGLASLSSKHFVKLLKALEIDKKVLLEAYVHDYTDAILEVIKKAEIIEKRLESRRETEKKETQNRLEDAQDGWKMLGRN